MTTESKTQTLPVLPLESGVILPQMVVTVALESPEAKDAVGAAERNGSVLLLLPRIDGRYARVGTVARLEDTGELPGGQKIAVFRGRRGSRPVGRDRSCARPRDAVRARAHTRTRVPRGR